jgi:hypothetical protein
MHFFSPFLIVHTYTFPATNWIPIAPPIVEILTWWKMTSRVWHTYTRASHLPPLWDFPLKKSNSSPSTVAKRHGGSSPKFNTPTRTSSRVRHRKSDVLTRIRSCGARRTKIPYGSSHYVSGDHRDYPPWPNGTVDNHQSLIDPQEHDDE